MATIEAALKNASIYYTPLTKAHHALQDLAKNQEIAQEIATKIMGNISKIFPRVVANHANAVQDITQEFKPTQTNPVVYNYYISSNPHFKGGHFSPFYAKVQEIITKLGREATLDEMTLKTNFDNFFLLVRSKLRSGLEEYQKNSSWKSEICLAPLVLNSIVDPKVKALQICFFKGEGEDGCVLTSISRYTFSATKESEIPEGTEVGGYSQSNRFLLFKD